MQPPQLQVQREPLGFVFLTAKEVMMLYWSVDLPVTRECLIGFSHPLVRTTHHNRFGLLVDLNRAVAHLVHQMD